MFKNCVETRSRCLLFQNGVERARSWNHGVPCFCCQTVFENNAHKHPGRKVMKLNDAVDMIEYVINMPYHLNVNELSIDPIQTEWPNE